jgi:hypothetical protein
MFHQSVAGGAGGGGEAVAGRLVLIHWTIGVWSTCGGSRQLQEFATWNFHGLPRTCGIPSG